MSDNEDLKAKMREALDKKAHQHHASEEAPADDGGDKSHGAAKPIAPPEFRRKAT